MSKRLGVVAMMLLLIASFAVVSASEQVSLVNEGGNVVKPAQNAGMNPDSILIVYDSITQGETNWHTKTVSSFITTLNVDLNWGNPSNSLRLRIYSPDGYTFGPYYDNFDGVNDGRINLNIIYGNGIAQGTWNYEVYGDSVTGTQAYSI
ncbi:MAG: peptidase domain-containing protein [Methanoregula sp.]|nr:peptidase domain-containing protein [Methanoregula sp.]